MTNYEKIKQMSVNQLAEFIANNDAESIGDYVCKSSCENKRNGECMYELGGCVLLIESSITTWLNMKCVEDKLNMTVDQ